MIVVTTAFATGLITNETHGSLIDSSQPALARTTKFISMILDKIELDVTVYDKFINILCRIPALCPLAEKKLSDSGYVEGDSYSIELPASASTASESEVFTEIRDSDGQRTAQREGVPGNSTIKESHVGIFRLELMTREDTYPHCSPLD